MIDTKKSWETLEQNCTQISCIEWYHDTSQKNHEKHFSKIKQKNCKPLATLDTQTLWQMQE